MAARWFAVDVPTEGRLAMVLDVCDSDDAAWTKLWVFTQGLLSALADNMRVSLYCLGNSQPYESAAIANSVSAWREANIRRTRLVTPIFDVLNNAVEVPIVVLAAHRVFDAADWQATPLEQRVVWVRLGETAVTEQTYPELEPLIDQLCPRLASVPARVEVSGVGSLPFFWDNPAYQWDGGCLSSTTPPYGVRIGSFGPMDALMQVTVTLSNGSTYMRSAAPGAAVEAMTWQTLSSRENDQARRCIKEGRYDCPHCHDQHLADALRCPATGGELAWPSLAPYQGVGFVEIEVLASTARFRSRTCPHLPLLQDRVAIRNGTQASIYAYDSHQFRWGATGEKLRPWQRVGERRYALCL